LGTEFYVIIGVAVAAFGSGSAAWMGTKVALNGLHEQGKRHSAKIDTLTERTIRMETKLDEHIRLEQRVLDKR
jgi:hypothetical protein